MKKLFLTMVLFFGSVLSSFGVYQYCDDCWQNPIWTSNGWVTINWTFTGGGSDCYNSYQNNNMYPWSTAYIYQNGVLIGIDHYNDSYSVACHNYI